MNGQSGTTGAPSTRDLDDLARLTATLNAHLRAVAPVEVVLPA